MIAVILAGVFGGQWLDSFFETEKVFTVIFSLVSVFAAIYLALKDFISFKK